MSSVRIVFCDALVRADYLVTAAALLANGQTIYSSIGRRFIYILYICVRLFFSLVYDRYLSKTVNPFKTALSFWGQTIQKFEWFAPNQTKKLQP